MAASILFGSAFAIRGTEVANRVWKGAAMKWPAESNHSVNERLTSIVSVLPLLEVMEILTMYSGTFFLVDVDIEI